jgi:outer membrane receptor protein involved in Fe transport
MPAKQRNKHLGDAHMISPRLDKSEMMRIRDHVTLISFVSGILSIYSPCYADSSARDARALEEVIVTATKRDERLQDVPVSIGVLSGENLESRNVGGLSELGGYVPGIYIPSNGSPGHNNIVIRGLSVGANVSGLAPTVSAYIDNIPIGPTNGAAGAGAFGLDLLPYDLTHIEVLRGPQGTLYGAGAMAGLLKYSLRKPSLTKFDARVGADWQTIDGSAGAGWTAHGSISAPIVSDKLGILISGYHRDFDGYIDNLGTGINDANDLKQYGGRAALLWKPTDHFQLQATLLAQTIDQADATGVTLDPKTFLPIYGYDKRSSALPEPTEQTTRLASIEINWDLNFATLTSSSSWSRLRSQPVFDFGNLYNRLFVPSNPDGYSAFKIDEGVDKFTQEIRLTSPENQTWQWMLGGFYTNEDNFLDSSWVTYTQGKELLPQSDNLYDARTPGDYREWATFGNMTYEMTKSFDISAGLRYASNKHSTCIESEGPFGANVGVQCTTRPYQSKTTWMGNARYRLNEASMFYARVATGYRPGGGCTGCGMFGAPDFYYPDTMTSYDMGYKGQLFDDRVQLDVALFYVDWKDAQINVIGEFGRGYVANLGAAESTGVEIGATAQVTSELQLVAALSYTDAQLKEDFLAAGGKSGDDLPSSPHWTGSLIADYVRPVSERFTVLLGADYRYVDTAYNAFPGDATMPGGFPMNPQSVFGIYAGVELGSTTIKAFAKNLLNDRSYVGILYLADSQRPVFNPVQPRTIGVAIEHEF